MVNSKAIVNIVGRITNSGSAPCKKTLQKILNSAAIMEFIFMAHTAPIWILRYVSFAMRTY